MHRDENNSLRRFGMTIVALVGLVLLVACTNLANLVLARGTARQGELAVRMAMGASRGRLIWEQCIESLLLALGGAAASYVMFQVVSAMMTMDFNDRPDAVAHHRDSARARRTRPWPSRSCRRSSPCSSLGWNRRFNWRGRPTFAARSPQAPPASGRGSAVSAW